LLEFYQRNKSCVVLEKKNTAWLVVRVNRLYSACTAHFSKNPIRVSEQNSAVFGISRRGFDMQIVLTVLFESPFWIGVFEREEQHRVSVARVVFGAEPTSPEIVNWIFQHYFRLEFSAVSIAVFHKSRPVNPKRASREAKQATVGLGVSSIAQEAMRLELERRKIKRRTSSKEEREAKAERQFQIRQAKAKARHRGR
jgi:hypothetical protein